MTSPDETNTEVLSTPPTVPAQPVPWHVKPFTAEKPAVTVNEKAVIDRQGRDFVLYWGLLDAAHRAGMRSIFTTLVQAPSSTNGGIAIVHATVEFDWGSYTGIGDADDKNVNRNIAPAKIRMAETRAKARALRDALNVNMVAVEEMADLPGDKQPDDPAPRSDSTPTNAPTRRPAQPAPPDRDDRPAPPVRGGGKAAALDKFNRLKETYLRLADAHALVRDDALIAPFTEDADPAAIEAASQRLLARINTAVQRRPNGNTGSA